MRQIATQFHTRRALCIACRTIPANYRETTAKRCTVALLLDIDPIGLVRGKGFASSDAPPQQYVYDPPYVASSFVKREPLRR